MSNVFVSLPVPAIPGVGAAVAVSGIAPEKSLVLLGPGGPGSDAVPTGASGVLSLEVSEDGVNFGPFLTLDRLGDPGTPTFTVVCSHMRVRRLAGFGSTGVTVTVAGESTTSNTFATLTVPADGVGPGLLTSSVGGQKTVVLTGNYTGVLVVEGSVNGGVTYDPLITCNTGASDTYVLKGIFQYMRVRRIGGGAGTPSITVGGHPFVTAGAGANSCIFKWGGSMYVPMPNGQVPNPLIGYFTDGFYSVDGPDFYVTPAAGTVSLFQVNVVSNDCDGTTTFTVLKGVVPTTQAVVVPPGGTGRYVTAGASVAFALNEALNLMGSIADDSGGDTIEFTATCLYTIS